MEKDSLALKYVWDDGRGAYWVLSDVWNDHLLVVIRNEETFLSDGCE